MRGVDATHTPAARRPVQAVVIGASSGAVEALSVILPALPRTFALPVLVVVHVPADRKSMLANIFQAKCQLPVREAEDKEPLVGGVVYFAPPDYHLLVNPNRTLSLSSEEPVHFCRPAIDVLFESAADAFGPGLVGIVLTGANADGAQGLRAVQMSGGQVVVQRPDLAMSAPMPQAALDACPGAPALDLEQIAAFLQEVGA